MSEELWSGPESKVENAAFHLLEMGKAILPPERSHMNVVLESTGAILEGNWHRAFYAHLDAFLSATRSIPEIIQCCFGVDRANPVVKKWFDALSEDEQLRRKVFRQQFKSHYDAFRFLDLGKARHVSEHRAGYAPVQVQIKGFFGVIYTGTAVKPIPISETRKIDNPEYAFLGRPRPVRPSWQDFTINGKPLFKECEDYLQQARALIGQARAISTQVHGSSVLTEPPI